MEYPEFRRWVKRVMKSTEEDLRNLTY